MEFALNLAWFVIAVASYALLARHLACLHAGNANGPSPCKCIVALSCALAILFPVISLTDDLHEIQAAAEEPSSSCIVMKRCGVRQPLAQTGDSHQVAYIVSSSHADVCWIAFAVVDTRRALYRSTSSPLTAFGRAPPSFGVAQFS